jgi:protein phosphatase
MFTGGSLPYGQRMERCKTLEDFYRLEYVPSYQHREIIPVWFDKALEKACKNNPAERYDSLEEFIHDLQHPNPEFLKDNPASKSEGNTVFFWKILSFLWLAVLLVVLILVFQNSD